MLSVLFIHRTLSFDWSRTYDEESPTTDCWSSASFPPGFLLFSKSLGAWPRLLPLDLDYAGALESELLCGPSLEVSFLMLAVEGLALPDVSVS